MKIDIKKSGVLNASTILNYIFIALVLTSDYLFAGLGIPGVYSFLEFIMFGMVFYAFFSKKNYLKVMLLTPILFWTIWVVYNYINWKQIGIVNAEFPHQFVLSSFVYPILTMSIVYYEGCKNLKRTTTVVLAALAVYVIGGLLFQGDNDTTRGVWDDTERGGGVLGNALPLNACILTFFSIFAYFKGWVNKKWLCLLLVFSLASIFFVATRKALAGWLFIVFMPFLSNFDFRKPSSLYKLVLLIGVIYMAYQYVIEETYLGERLMQTAEQGEESNESDVEALNFLGDRALQYIMAWDFFGENPITGIGLYNFQVVADFPMALHSEYMVQLCECGIIGSVLYLLFMSGLIAKIMIIYNRNSKLFFVFVGGILCILSFNFTAWTYQGTAYFAMYGIILASCQKHKQ